ncbi:MAG: hypothetical protein JKY34_05425 [Kordiimonadaceae bacterium]|nr:hypothetical protein [Kordiimonadaceae bacterium]
MPLNIRGERAKQRERALQVRLMETQAKPLEVALYNLIKRTGARAAQLQSQGLEEQAALDAVQEFQEAGEGILTRSLRKSGLLFGSRLLDTLGKSQYRRLEVKSDGDVFQRRLEKWLAVYSSRQITRIAETTRKHIRRIMVSGARDGLSVEQISKNIRTGLKGPFSRTRAHTIARTETHNAANRGAMAAAEATGLTLYKEWVAAGGSRTRGNHSAVSGQIRPQNDPFNVGGTLMQQPGDPAGGAGNVINCRCVVVFSTEPPTRAFEGGGVPGGSGWIKDANNDFEGEHLKARKYCRKLGRDTGFEHMMLVDTVTGRNLGKTTSNAVNMVSPTSAMMREMSNPKNAIMVHHNHPSSSPLSMPDLQASAYFKGVKGVYAHGHNGNYYLAEGFKRSEVIIGSEFKQTLKAITTIGRDYEKRHPSLKWTGLERGQLYYHLTHTVLSVRGLYSYRYKLDPKFEALITEHKTLINEVDEWLM